MKIVLIRHGGASHEDRGIFAGSRINSILTEEGKMQALKLSEYLRDKYQINKIFCSDLTRSWQTGGIIKQELKKNGLLATLIKTSLLDEVDVGKFSGKSKRQSFQINRQAAEVFYESKIQEWDFPGGENFLKIKERASGLFEFVARKMLNKADKTVLLVGHAIFNLALLETFFPGSILSLPDKNFLHNLIVSFYYHQGRVRKLDFSLVKNVD